MALACEFDRMRAMEPNQSLTEWCAGIDEKHRQWMLLGLTDRGVEIGLARHILDKLSPRPIPVSERLPEDCSEVLVYIEFARDGFGDWGVGSCLIGDWSIWGQCCQEEEGHEDEKRTVTHWLPLPPKPE